MPQQRGEDIGFDKNGYEDFNVYKLIVRGNADAVFSLEYSGIKKIRRDFLKKQKICLDKMYIHNVCFRERIRIISARISTNEEERRYEEWCKQFYG